MCIPCSQDIRECCLLERNMHKVDVVDCVYGLVLSNLASDVMQTSIQHYRVFDLLQGQLHVRNVRRQARGQVYDRGISFQNLIGCATCALERFAKTEILPLISPTPKTTIIADKHHFGGSAYVGRGKIVVKAWPPCHWLLDNALCCMGHGSEMRHWCSFYPRTGGNNIANV